MVDAEGGKEQNEKARSKHDIQNHVRNAVVGKVPQNPRLAEWLNMIEHALTISFKKKGRKARNIPARNASECEEGRRTALCRTNVQTTAAEKMSAAACTPLQHARDATVATER